MVCPRCSLPGRPGWVFYDDYLLECISCGFVLRDFTPAGFAYKGKWKYQIRHFKRQHHSSTHA